jgi:hypothetical protein
MVVVDLAVENDPATPVLVRHRLMPTIDVDDRESAMAKGDGIPHVVTLTVRTSMAQTVGHLPDRSRDLRRQISLL